MRCPKQVRRVIEEIVLTKVAAGMMFTAYDVTCAVRAVDIYILHDTVRAVVHAMYENHRLDVTYERTLVDLGGARGPALVYHRYDDLPTLKLPRPSAAFTER